jgi:hypothetical protein
LVLAAALLPRLYQLGDFLTIDEVKWAEGAAQFLLALHDGDLSQTYWHFFPGITIAWGSALALWAVCLPAPELATCARGQVAELAASIGWLRLSPVLLASLGVMGVYLLGRKILGERPAWLTALLLAFDPFFIAHSRILNGDAGAAILMFLALLGFLAVWLRVDHEPGGGTGSPWPGRRVWQPALVLSGVMAGLALLTKLPSPLIGLFVGALGLTGLIGDTRRTLQSGEPMKPILQFWPAALLVWGGLALLVFVLLWPAMWVAPLETLRRLVVDAFEIGEAGAGHDAFFLEQTLSDPGPWFYPYAVAFRLTPPVMLGLVPALGWLLFRLGKSLQRLKPALAMTPGPDPQPAAPTSPAGARTETAGRQFTVVLVMLAYVVFIILFANLSPKKLDRYVMAVIPALILLAAMGLHKLIEFALPASPSRPPHHARHPNLYHQLVLLLIVALQLLFSLRSAPYFLTYYNPLLGGITRATNQVPVGWGEGLEQAARYLNGLDGAHSLTVSSWYSDIFDPYFVGQRASFADDGRAQLASDYVVFYVNQLQRRIPYPGLIDYFRSNRPVFVLAVQPSGQAVPVAGEDLDPAQPHWVEVYKAPAAQSAGGAPAIEGVARLLAYKVEDSHTAEGFPELRGGQDLAVTLFLQVLGPLPPDTTFQVSLVPTRLDQPEPAAPISNDSEAPEINNPGPDLQNRTGGQGAIATVTGDWLEGQIVEWHGTLTWPSAMPPGEYRFWAAYRFKDGPLIAEFSISDQDPTLRVRDVLE